MSVLLVEKSGGIATITLNRPEALNALNAELRHAIERAFRELAQDDEVRRRDPDRRGPRVLAPAST